MRWRRFCDELVQGFIDLGADMIVLLGALLADAPHTRPVPISGSVSESRLAAELSMQPVDYKGPTGIVGVLQQACGQAGLTAVSLWASVPHYVAQPPNPKATLALIRGIEDIVDLTLPLADLPEQARAWERGVDELAQQDSEVAEYVRALEDQRDATELPEASGDAIATRIRTLPAAPRRPGDSGHPRPPRRQHLGPALLRRIIRWHPCRSRCGLAAASTTCPSTRRA